MTNVMNVKNDNNNKGHYPLFLDEPLGFNDSVNVTYPDVKDMAEMQQGMFWLASEFNFSTDRQDLKEAPESERDVMVLNLLSQWLLDSVASRSIIEIFGPLTTNPETHSWFMWQSAFEDIHAETYAKIVRNCFTDGNAILERGKNNLDVFERSKVIGEVFNELSRKGAEWQLGIETDKRVMRKTLLKGVFTLYALEAISFMASFACTFALVESGRYQNIGKAVGSICNDELCHAEGDKRILKHLLADPDYRSIFDEERDEFVNIINNVVKQELHFADYIFEEGRKVLGLTSNLLKEYVAFIAIPVYDTLEIDYPVAILGDKPQSNPCSYMDKYIDRDMMQTANQEITNNNYRVGQVVNDMSDVEFDVDF